MFSVKTAATAVDKMRHRVVAPREQDRRRLLPTSFFANGHRPAPEDEQDTDLLDDDDSNSDTEEDFETCAFCEDIVYAYEYDPARRMCDRCSEEMICDTHGCDGLILDTDEINRVVCGHCGNKLCIECRIGHTASCQLNPWAICPK
jgi:hypothetical protein